MIHKVSKLVLLTLASFGFVAGISGAILFFPTDDSEVSQARSASPKAKIDWQTSLAAGSDVAKQQHKYVLADVYNRLVRLVQKAR